jgi:hypothetical protein
MTPQSNFMIVAPVATGRTDDLRQLLATMNRKKGIVDVSNCLIPFAELDRLHFARLVILEDQTIDDIRAYGRRPPDYPLYLAFLGDFDGPSDDFLADMSTRCESGLRAIFSHCEDYDPAVQLISWVKQHNNAPATTYVNWIGRTMLQVREEDKLRVSIESYLREKRNTLSAMTLQQAHTTILDHVRSEQRRGILRLSPQEATPLKWEILDALHLVAVPLLLLMLAPILLVYAPAFLVQLRRRERSDAEIVPRIDPDHAGELASLEDHDVSNQFSAFGAVKPGTFRRWTLIFFLWAIDYTTKHIFNRGRLARVSTIHFARWVFLDDKDRLFFASNYDGSLDSYMDDFINKVAFGLNLVFSNGIGYPSTNWLILDGAKDEQKFKYYIRRHQIPTEVWYNAHPGLTALDLERNSLIRAGLEKASPSDSEIQQWLQLL